MTRFQNVIEWTHLYAGLAAAPLLLLLGLTGSILSFEYPLDQVLNHKLNYVRPQGVRVSLDELLRVAAASHPNARVTTLALSPYSPAPDLAYTALVVGAKVPETTVYLDQYTGTILGQHTGRTFTSAVHNLHTNLMTGEDRWGSIPLAITAALLILLSLTGLILWWPRKIISVNWQASSRRITFDLHNALGFYSFLFMLLFGVTGVIIHYLPVMLPATNRALHIDGSEPEFHVRPPNANTARRSLEEIARTATASVPGARLTQIGLPKRDGVYRVWMKYPEDHTPLGRTNLLIDPYSGAVLWQRTSRNAAMPTRFYRQWNHELHTGDFFGWPGKILLCLMSLVLPVLAVTGPLFWFRKRRRPSKVSQPNNAKSYDMVP
ncbi:MAG: PepSY-associated TM helix domain-containing protein [Edaphobacter sp.]